MQCKKSLARTTIINYLLDLVFFNFKNDRARAFKTETTRHPFAKQTETGQKRKRIGANEKGRDEEGDGDRFDPQSDFVRHGCTRQSACNKYQSSR